MPVLLAPRDKLFEYIGKSFTDDEFDELCFQFGIELDDITSEKKMLDKETALKVDHLSYTKELSEEILYKIEIPANRYDLISTEGLAIALRVFLGIDKIPPKYSLVNTEKMESLFVDDSVSHIRPYVFSAILRNVKLDPYSYDSFIKLQDKLHQTISRHRTLASMGTHDYDTIKGPFKYIAKELHDIDFVPLNQTRSIKGTEILEFYNNDLKIKKYTHILKDFTKFPIFEDANQQVCSLPPLINSELSKIKLTTRNILIDVTSTDATKGEMVLKTLVAAFSFHCQEKFTIEPVKVIYSSDKLGSHGKSIWSLDLSDIEYTLSIDYFNRLIGVNLNSSQILNYLNKMMYLSTLVSSSSILVKVPFQRTDVLHPCDIMEDVAIGYGFNNIKKTIPNTSTIAAPFLLNKLSDSIRIEMALSGYTEVLTLSLCSLEENGLYLRTPEINAQAVQLSNPKTAEYQVVRTSLLPGLFKTLSSNRAVPLPLKLFEVSDIVVKDTIHSNTGARNERRLAAMFCGKVSGFELIHGVLDHIMKMLNVKRIYLKDEAHSLSNNISNLTKLTFSLRESICQTFLEGRRGDIILHKDNLNLVIGTIGVVHPDVLQAFDIHHVVSAFEMNLEPFL